MNKQQSQSSLINFDVVECNHSLQRQQLADCEFF